MYHAESPHRWCLRARAPGAAPAMAVALLMLATGTPAAADDGFERCIDTIAERAADEGISAATIDGVLRKASQLERVIAADRRQPEFTDPFTRYLNLRVNDARVARGRELLERHGALLDRIRAEYGISPQYLLSFWALETNFGSYFGEIPVFDSLATLACDPRRGGYFTGELIAALHIVDEGHIDPDDMVGSWAGAMGHTQFMPSVYRRYAVDGDGNGRIDLWNSVEDALTSAANFLRGIGWAPGWRWGREVALPDGFDYALAGRDRNRTLAEWRELGVRRTDGGRLPADDTEASLVVPAGHRGPAFLVYPNFDVIMRWNRSEFFALTVGHLADRIAGEGPLSNPPPEDLPRLTRDQVRALQAALNARGFDSGTPDGILGPATRSAIRDFQRAEGWVADGFPDEQVLDALTSGR